MTDSASTPIDDWTIQTYLRELVNQAESAAIAVKDFNAALNSGVDGISRAFAAVQSLLGAAALISKLLWPQPSSRKPDGTSLTDEDEERRTYAIARGRQLKELTEIKGIPILENRKVRNALEHFDERLDEYFRTGHSLVADRNIGPKDRMIVVDGSPAVHLRLIDNERLTASVLNDEVSLQELSDAVQRVGTSATAAIAKLQSRA